ncbi:Transmembrane protein 60, partial [Stegodyphus mimosarum]
MAVLHRALLTWFLFAVFLILLTLRLDEKTDWDWFIIFIPLWIFDFKLLVFITFRIVTHCRNGHDRSFVTMYLKCWYLFCVLLKVTFQILLAIRLQYYSGISWYYIMIPLWILLVGMCGEVFFNLVSHRSF